VVAVYPFTAIEPGDLSLIKGEQYIVLDDSQVHSSLLSTQYTSKQFIEMDHQQLGTYTRNSHILVYIKYVLVSGRNKNKLSATQVKFFYIYLPETAVHLFCNQRYWGSSFLD